MNAPKAAVQTLEEGWALFERTIVPATAGKIQRRDMRMAFYAGASVFYEIAVLKAAALPEDEAVQVMNSLSKELAMFTATTIAEAFVKKET